MHAIILVAGQSSQLGEPKIVVNFKGKNLLEKSCLIKINAFKDVLVLLGSKTQKSIEIIWTLPFNMVQIG